LLVILYKVEVIVVNKLFILFIILPLLLPACLATQRIPDSPPSESAPIGNGVPVAEDSQYEQDLDALIEWSDYIVVGEVAVTEVFDESTQKATVDVAHDYKGRLAAGSSISIHENSDVLQKGQQVLLFLDLYDSRSFPEPFYTPVTEDSVVRLEGDTPIARFQLIEDITTTDQLLAYIQQSTHLKSPSQPVTVLDSVDMLDELISASDAIFELIPTRWEVVGPKVSSFTFDAVRSFKGSMDELELVNLPTSITVGETYIVFMKSYRENSLSLTTRHGSLLHSSDEAWDDTVRALESLQ